MKRRNARERLSRRVADADASATVIDANQQQTAFLAAANESTKLLQDEINALKSLREQINSEPVPRTPGSPASSFGTSISACELKSLLSANRTDIMSEVSNMIGEHVMEEKLKSKDAEIAWLKENIQVKTADVEKLNETVSELPRRFPKARASAGGGSCSSFSSSPSQESLSLSKSDSYSG
jgi:hypothetical protein